MQLEINEKAIVPVRVFKEGTLSDLNMIQISGLAYDCKLKTAKLTYGLFSVTVIPGTSPGPVTNENPMGTPGMMESQTKEELSAGDIEVPADVLATWNGNDDVLFNFILSKNSLSLAV